jgi:hypothetical protein
MALMLWLGDRYNRYMMSVAVNWVQYAVRLESKTAVKSQSWQLQKFLSKTGPELR